MRFQCPFCSYVMMVEDSHRGYKVNCPSCGKSVLVPVGRFEDGCVVGDFVIRGKIGEGSIGAVYRAVQISLDRMVALKILSPEYTNAKGLTDFLREARAAAKLIHTNIVQALAVGEEDGTCYMAMTYINGETVKARMKREGKIPVDEALHIVQQVAEALYYAWDEAGMIHRDVKPDNIMITEDGIVKLTDLGLAMQQTEWREDMEISGSPSYMSPEQFTGEKLDSRSDIYSLGVTLYQMIAGILPFDGQTVKTVAKQHFEEEPVPLNKRDPQVPAKVAQFVRKMMEKSPEDRFKDLEELLHGIWTLRQRTAPDTSLIPDVHTISIKRLDYDMQQDMIEKRNSGRKSSSLLFKFDLVKISIIAVPALIVFAILLALFLGRSSANEDKMGRSLEYFARLMADKTMDLDELQKEGSKILSEFGSPSSPRQEQIQSQLKYYLADIGRRKAEQDLQKLKANLKDSQLQLSSLKSNVDTLKQRADQNAKRGSSAEDDRNALKSELAHLKAALAKSDAEAAQLKISAKSLSDYVKRLHSEGERLWMDDFRIKLFTLVSQCRLREADSAVSLEAAKRSEVYKDYFAARDAEIDRMDRIFTDLSESGTKFTGSSLDADSKVVIISSGTVEYQDSISRIRQKPWTEFQTDSLAALVSKDSKVAGTDVEIKASIELLKGNVGAAVKLKPGDKELSAAAKAVLQQGIDSVKVIAAADRRRAEAKTATLLKQFDGADELVAQLKAELKQFLPKREAE